MRNPAFNATSPFTRTTDVRTTSTPMTLEGTINRTLLAFLTLLAGALAGWTFPIVTLPASLTALVIAIIALTRKTAPAPGLVLTYAAIEGAAIGGLSRLFDTAYDGIVIQALAGTLGVVGATFLLYKNNKVRTSPTLNRVWLISMFGMIGYGLINLVLMLTGVVTTPFGLDTQITIFGMPLGIILGVFCVLLGAYSLVRDFETVTNGIRNEIDSSYEWSAALGFMITVVWIYVEILRILAITRNR